MKYPEGLRKNAESRVNKGKTCYSKVPQELFNAIYEQLPEELKQECYYATCKTDEHNKEFGKIDVVNDSYYFYDFTLSHLKFIIEFDGDYRHEEGNIRDLNKQKLAENLGFKFLRIWESSYIKSKQEIVDFCLHEIMSHLS